ncbi:MBL fold metallo-hydrolase [Oceanispirochaeta crateris]|uniref:MBL fold metallo-hydrolase n=1 Tax=Oceanispirochaeta crateris TaxID=2518645 RepID=UPI00143CD35F|nr:MBL fold metallo-hydrolase [Oceanispirochaeta crateris]
MKADSTRFAILGSGSAANGYVFESGNFSFIIDNGYSLSEFRRRMKQLDFSESKLTFIFLTHHHSDHFKGVEPLSSALGIPVVTHKDMPLEKYCKKEGLHRLDIIPGKEYSFDSLQFRCFETSHDAASSVGYHFTLNNLSFTIITDTGIVSDEMMFLAAKSDYLFLESNYSPELLHNGPYPDFLKRRILSDKGHLSNLDAAVCMSRLSEMENLRLKKIFLCHLSEKNNNVEKVKEEVSRIYEGAIPYAICPRNDCLSQKTLIRSD